MYELMIESDFSAAHQLREAKGGCERLHGHTWHVRVSLAGEHLKENGILIDFREAKRKIGRWIRKLDHQFLNETMEGLNPTTENIARYLYERIGQELNCRRFKVKTIRVWESKDCSVCYSQPNEGENETYSSGCS